MTLNTPLSNEDLFYLESDHLALRGNKDYCELLKAIFILSSQREKAIKNYSDIVKLKTQLLADPLAVVQQLQSNQSIELPSKINIAKIPNINFNKYEEKVSEEGLKLINSTTLEEKYDPTSHFKQQKMNNSKWTFEEQKRLEELLVVYPPEPIEARRFQKIAKALGNRTLQQVSSRVQKYFLKLYRAGLPIPGRIPKSCEKHKRKKSAFIHKHQKYNHYLWKPTTFFPELFVPVAMDDLDNVPGPSTNHEIPSNNSANYLIPNNYHGNSITPEETHKNESDLQLALLKRIKQVKLDESDESYEEIHHVGYRCDYCNTEPIVGTRWHCTSCLDSVDYCTDCFLSQMYSERPHSLYHKFVDINITSECSSTNGTNLDHLYSDESSISDSEMSDTNDDDTENFEDPMDVPA